MNPLPPITVLKGGISSEREVSLRSGAAVARALREAGCEVDELDITTVAFDLPAPGRVLFIGLHGTFGEDGMLQRRLDEAGRIYTGPGAEACRLSFDKLLAREKFQQGGVRIARGGAWTPETEWPAPFVLKPVADGSSVGVSIARTDGEVEQAREAAAAFGRPMMVEEFIAGRELTVGLLDGRPLPVVEMRPLEGFYDYTNKYTAGRTQHLCPAPLTPEERASVEAAAAAAYRAVGCSVYARVDVILPDDGSAPVVLELNALPGMTDLSLFPEAAAADGISFPELCRRIVELSLEARR
ncbi:MAG: D-alanine--D-alanine ligase [Candidatus Methylacidiphilales bacterium]|nr:D-alanine--D-alanine ligase [Candidatus Methylacidiphilales bacterium]